jgi:hypothetical protein
MTTYKENILSLDVIEHFDQYCKLLPTDDSSNYSWKEEFTKASGRPECFSQQFEGDERFMIQNDLYTNPESPFYKDKRIRNTNVAIQKYPKGASILCHSDRNIGSFTIFLNKEWGPNDGGMLHWETDEGDKCLLPKYNCGIIITTDGLNNKPGPKHWVSAVKSDTPRCAIQIFMYGDKLADNEIYID